MYVYVYICIYTHIYLYVYIYVFTYMHVYIHDIHTYSQDKHIADNPECAASAAAVQLTNANINGEDISDCEI